MSNMVVRIGGDATQFKQVLNGVQSQASKAGKNIASSLASPLGVAMGGAGISAGIIMAGKAMIDAGDKIDKGSQKLGISAEQYQRLDRMAGDAGATIEQVIPAFSRMAKVLQGADEESKTAQKSLERIGLTVEDLKGKRPDEQFGIIARRLSAITDESTKAATAQAIFGRSALELMPLINSYDDLESKFKNVTVMTDENVKAAARYKDAMEAIGFSIQNSLVNTGFIQWLANAAEGMDVLTDASGKLSAKGSSGFQKVKDNLKVFAAGLADANINIKAIDLIYKVATGEDLPTFTDLVKTSAENEAAKPITEEEKRAQKEIEIQKELDKMLAESETFLSHLRAKRIEEEEAAAKAKIEAEKKALAEAERAAKEKERQQEAAAKQVADMEHELKMQQMINDGMAREAAIEDEIYKAKQRSSELTEQQIADIADMAGQMYDLKNSEDAKKQKDQSFKVDTDVAKTALERIGAIMGGGKSSDPAFRLQTEHVRIAKESLTTQKAILNKTGDAALGSV
jgi:hypothetical protein